MFQRSIYDLSVIDLSISDMCICLSIYLSMYTFIYPFIYTFIYISMCQLWGILSAVTYQTFLSSCFIPPLISPHWHRCWQPLWLPCGRINHARGSVWHASFTCDVSFGHERCLVSSTFFWGCLCSSCHIVAFHDFCVCFYFTPEISGQWSMQSQEAKLVLSTPYSTGAAVLSLATSLHEWQESSQYRRRIFHQMLLVAWICPTTALRPTPWHLFLELTSIQQSHWQSSSQSWYRMGSMINT